MNKDLHPFQDESTVLTVGELALENRTDRVSIHGSVDITRDRAGLQLALKLKDALDRVVAALSADQLPEKIELDKPSEIPNPFGAGGGQAR